MELGLSEGDSLGTPEGAPEGDKLGDLDGMELGSLLTLGLADGALLG